MKTVFGLLNKVPGFKTKSPPPEEKNFSKKKLSIEEEFDLSNPENSKIDPNFDIDKIDENIIKDKENDGNKYIGFH